ncbi:nitroreductase [Bisgaardia hudsonensis]|uniref:Putative NAD(P)H nitroreductase n=1 Tax=Bisgaardia hudsonensis TaxID=109472 RepID=A0A4R2N183_9PAST|nr:NAD(P)H nitroreductase [Bisgaardia hudsonensis]QLB13112.1 nitroreductase [Bisgaardia hudsonensis]TCP13317.1 nitroreductase [Bisgaardia hudsonensis]
MDALELLTSRRSEKKLAEPAPNKQQLEYLFQSALHVPDHGKLNPYHFIVIEKEGLAKFEKLLESVVDEFDLGEERLRKAKSIAYRAPMVIAVIAKLNEEIKKVPTWEQELTAGCATYAMQLAAKAQGFDNVWITGPWVNGSELRKAFKCEQQDKVVALLLIGTAGEKLERDKKILDTDSFISYLE